MKFNIIYNVSTYPSKFKAYQSKKNSRLNDCSAIITNFISNLEFKDFERSLSNYDRHFDLFVRELVYFQLVERICLEYALNKSRIKNRCRICKPSELAFRCMYLLEQKIGVE